MFCNHCGNALQSEYSVCPYCGSLVQGAVASPNEGRVERHIKIIAILWMIMAGLWLIPGFAMLALGIVVPFFVPMDDTLARSLGPLVVQAVGIVLLFVGAGGILTAGGLLRRRPWARIVTIVLACLALFHPPFATALGVYTLWVLLPAESAHEYEGMIEA